MKVDNIPHITSKTQPKKLGRSAIPILERSARSASKKPGDFSDAPLLKGCAFFDAQEFRESWWSFFSLGFLQNF